MYNLLDLKSEDKRTKEIDEAKKEEILSIYDDFFLFNSRYIAVLELKNILKDSLYYVGSNFFIKKGKVCIYKGGIVVSSKENLIDYLLKVIRENDSRSIFIIPKNDKNMLLLLDNEGSLILKKKSL